MNLRIDEAPLPEVGLSCLTMTARSQGEAGMLVGRLFDRVFAAYAADGTPPGTPTAWYDVSGEEVRFGAGLDTPLREPGAFGLTNLTLAGSARGWIGLYRGPLPGVGQAWESLVNHVEAAGDVPSGVRREIYLEVSLDGSSDWVIELHQPVAG